jgi:CBS domain-containing protein
MKTVSKPLLALTAEDLMSTDVVTVPQEMSLQGAARLLSRSEIGGAPVVDGEGRCVGVLSATDFLSYAETGQPRKKVKNPGCMVSAWQVLESESLPADEVSGYMTADPVVVEPATPLGELAQMMVDAHIHRLIVVDEDNRPVGVVSSMDMLAAVARTAHKAARRDQ